MRRRGFALAAVIVGTFLVTLLILPRTESAGAATLGSVSPQPGSGQLCWHDDLSELHCPDSLARFVLVDASTVRSATVTLTMTDGSKKNYTVGVRADAIFLTQHSVEKFALPYYYATNPAKAEVVRAFLHQRLR